MALPQALDKSVSVSVSYPHVTSPHAGLIIPLVLALISAGSIYLQNRLPGVLPYDAAPSEFSASRAFEQLRTISVQPHPIGSAQHANVKDYIAGELSKLGLAPQRQQATAINSKRGMPIAAGAVENILVRIPGTSNSRALLLVAHYDSVPTSFGASDDGAGVVTLLETARALQSGRRLKNDVILLFTDGEEVGLLGAQAFVSEHPWSKDVGLFLNFEARGNSGPIFMFETTDDNGNLIRQFSGAPSLPVTSSFFYEIYKLLPNDTDFTVLKTLNAQGMNFAFLNGISHYHTSLDNPQEIDLSTLQQQGTNALALTRHLGDIDLQPTRSSNAIYFNLIGTVLIRYSEKLIFPLLAITALLFAFVVVHGFRKHQLRLTGILFGLAAVLIGAIASSGLTWVAWALIRRTQESLRSVPWNEPYHSGVFGLSFILLAIAAMSLIYLLLRRRTDTQSLVVGACFLWLLLSIATSVAIPGGSYLFTIPLLFTCISLAFFFTARLSQNVRTYALILFTAVPVIILWAPLVYNLFVALTVNATWMVIILLALPLGLLLPLMVQRGAAHRWLFPVVLTFACVALMVFGMFVSGFDRQQPKVNHVFYALNADNGKAMFASPDEAVDEWTRQFLSSGVERGAMTEFFPRNTRAFLTSPAVAAPVMAPEARLISDSRESGTRTLKLQLVSPRNAPVLAIYTQGDNEIIDASINGKRAMPHGRQSIAMRDWAIQFHGLRTEGIELVLTTKNEKPYKVLLVDHSYGLLDVPGLSIVPRTDNMIAAPNSTSDVSLISKSFSF